MTIVTHVEDGIGVLTLNAPPVNALSNALYRDLIDRLTELESHSDLRALVLASARSRVFCAGADVQEFAKREPGAVTLADEQRQTLARRAYDALLNFPYPTVGAVAGVALGAGAVLVACCDIRIAGESFMLGLPEASVVRCGGGRHLMRILPQGVVRRMYFEGVRLGPHEALSRGAVDEVVADDTVLPRSLAIAAEIASRSAVALRAAKSALNIAESLPIHEGYFMEQQHTLRLLGTHDAAEAVEAFVAKRRPQWTHS